MRIIKISLYSHNTGFFDCPDLLPVVRERLSVVDANARFAQAYNKHIPDRIYSITRSGRFDIGLFPAIKNVIDELDTPVKFEFTDDFKKACIPKFEYADDPLPVLDITPYDYQEQTIRRMLKVGRGTVLIGTGGGKTFIMALFTKMVMTHEPTRKMLVIVPTLQLVEQTYADFIDYGFDPKDISKWSGGYDRQDTDIIVANTSILQSSKSDISFLKDISLLMIDETHILKKNNKLNKIINKIPAVNRYGFTGTLPENIIDQWNVFGKTGPIIMEKNSKELRDGDFITEAKIDIIRVNYNIDDIKELHDLLETNPARYMCEVDFVISNEYRNALLCNTAKITRGNTLIMVDRIQHGDTLMEKLSGITHKDVYFIQGAVGVDEREKIRDLMETKSNIVCIAISKIFSTGINIKNINNIVFATPGKAKVKLIQSIGRGLRLHKNKSILRVIDFADNLHYSSKHLRKRVDLYDSEHLNHETRNINQPQRGTQG